MDVNLKFKKKLGIFRDNVFGDRNYKKFIIISGPRTGSNLLRSLLNSHPEVLTLGEEFKNISIGETTQIWKKIFRKRPILIKWVGFKLLYFHPQNNEDREIWDLLEKEKDLTVIHLIRKNYLDSFVSLQIGLKTRNWIETKNIRRHHLNKKVLIDIAELEVYFNKVEAYIKEIESNFSENQLLEVYYKDLVYNRKKALNRIFDFLKIKPIKTNTELIRQNPESLMDKISNYREVKNYFIKTKWKIFFED